MVAGRLTNKRGIYHIVLSYKDSEGKRKEKWFSTGLSTGGSKKKAENMLIEYRTKFDTETEKLNDETLKSTSNQKTATVNVPEIKAEPVKIDAVVINETRDEDILFADYLFSWLEKHKNNISLVTYASYKKILQGIICPYFKEKNIVLKDLTADDIEEFYEKSLETVSSNTVKHYHANIRKALQTAYIKGMIINNPADKVTLPKIKQYIGDYYNSNELLKLIECVKDKKIELAVLFASYYGLRRSEIVGLKWNAIDFTYKTITIKHTVTANSIDGKEQLILNDRGKTKKSYRTLPLLPDFEHILNEHMKKIEQNKVRAGEFYTDKFSEYIYVDEVGQLINPNYITQHFQMLLEKNGLRKIRFHDLRHSCATLLRHQGVPMEDIQKWLGHSNITTTERIYAHFEDERHWNSANKIAEKLSRKKDKDFEM